MRTMGRVQQSFLDAVRRHGAWSTYGGWVWGSRAHSIKLAEGLVKRGWLVKLEVTTPNGFTYTKYEVKERA